MNKKTIAFTLTAFAVTIPFLFAYDSIDTKGEIPAASETQLDIKTVLTPFRQAIISSNVESVVNTYNIREGEKFQKGQIIAKMDDSTILQKYSRAEASVNESEAAYKFAIKNLDSTKNLFEKNIASVMDVEKAQLEVTINIAKKQFNDANKIIAEIELEQCNIKAPFEGRLKQKMVQEFEYVRVGQQLMHIIDDTKLLAVMYVPSLMSNKIKLNDTIEIFVDEKNAVYSGTVHEIASDIDPASRTFELKVLIDNKDGELVPGMSGRFQRQINTTATESKKE